MSYTSFSVFHVVIFSSDDVVISGHEEHFYQSYGTGNEVLQPGNYVSVLCDVNSVGGNRSGVRSIFAADVRLDQEARSVAIFMAILMTHGLLGRNDVMTDKYNLRYGDCNARVATLDVGKESKAITVRPIRPDNLTSAQRQKTIGAIKWAPWAWDNATREAKDAMGVDYTEQDNARELLRRGVELATATNLVDADKTIREALGIDRTLVGARLELGKVAIHRGDIQEAIGWFNRELTEAKEPMTLEANDYLSAIYRALDDDIGAARHSEAARKTPGYHRHPSALSPEVVSLIQSAVRISKTHQGTVASRRWWQFWK